MQDNLIRMIKEMLLHINKKKEIWLSKNGGDLAKQLAEELKNNGYKTRIVTNEC